MRKTIYGFMFCLVAVFLIGVQTNVQADIIYSTFGSGYSYDTGSGYPVNLTGCEEAAPFTPTASYSLDSMAFALGEENDVSDQKARIYLATSAGSVPSFTYIESYLIEGIQALTDGIYTVNSTSHPVLNAGQEYWVIVTLDTWSTTMSLTWYGNGQGITEGEALHRDGFWYPTDQITEWWALGGFPPAFEVNGTPTVPEPATMLLLGLGLLGVFGIRRKVQK